MARQAEGAEDVTYTIEERSSTAPSSTQPYSKTETCTISITKRDTSSQLGISLATSPDGKWLVVTAVQPGALGASHTELKPGSKLLEIMANGTLHRWPSRAQAGRIISSAVGLVQLTIQPLLDRYGFIVSTEDFVARIVNRSQIRLENEMLRKWQKRVTSQQIWQAYAARKPEKIRQRVRAGVPDGIRCFVWKLMAAARAPAGFRREGVYRRLAMREDELPSFSQIDKDVPRTMTEHIFFRGTDSIGQSSLTRVLRAYASFNPKIGYCQGMSSYAAVLLLYMTEEDAFWVFASLMQFCGLEQLFEEGFPMLFHFYDRWEYLFKKHNSKLYAHVTKGLTKFLGLEVEDYLELIREGSPARSQLPGLYTTAWFQAMLVGGDSPAPSAFAPRIMDNILLDGNVAIIFQLGIAALEQKQKLILKQTGDTLAKTLKAAFIDCTDTHSLMLKAYEVNVKAKHIQMPNMPSAP